MSRAIPPIDFKDKGVFMIGSDSEYRQSVKMLDDWRKWIAVDKQHLKEAGHTPPEIKCMTDPAVSFCLGIAEEVEHYEAQHRP